MTKKNTEEYNVSKLIIDDYFRKLNDALSVDVAIVGGGPSGILCGYLLAKKGKKVTLFERKLSLGGGMWGGGMMFNTIVVQKELKRLFHELNINYEVVKNKYLVVDAPQCVSSLTFHASKAGVNIFNLVSVEDVAVKNNRVCGLVINWTSVGLTKLHVDPLVIDAKYVLDATGHDYDVTKKLIDRKGVKLKSKIDIKGERYMNIDLAEKEVVSNTKEVYPGLFVSGMAANAVFGGHRMGPIFGGMLSSGEKAAKELLKRLK